MGVRNLLLGEVDRPLAAVRMEPRLHLMSGDALVVRGVPRSASRSRIYAPSYHLELRPSVRQLAGHALLPHASVLAKARVLQGRSVDEFEAQGVREQAQSVQAAVFAACVSLGLPAVTRGSGVLVERVKPDGPSAGRIQRGDVITGVDGVAVDTVEAMFVAVRASAPGAVVAFDVVPGQRSGGDGATKRVVFAPLWTDDRPSLGLVVSTHRLSVDLPVDVDVDLPQGTAGPSAGLALALAVVDALAPHGIGGARDVTVAATGTIDGEGVVGAVGGVELKARAVAAHPDVDRLLVPVANLEEARRGGGRELDVIAVTSLDDALEVLRRP